MLDSELIQRKVNLIREDLIKLEDFKKLSLDKLAKDWLKRNALEHIFMKIIGLSLRGLFSEPCLPLNLA